MKLLWVSADKFGSRMIRWGLGSDCSHFAVCFDEQDSLTYGVPRGIAFHSYGMGTQSLMLRDFLKFYTVIHALEPIASVDEEAVYQAVINEEDERPYDYAALLWFSWRGLLAKIGFQPIELGELNQWQSEYARLCTGIAPTVLKALGIALPKGVDPELIPPHDLFRLLTGTGKFTSNPRWVDLANEV